MTCNGYMMVSRTVVNTHTIRIRLKLVNFEHFHCYVLWTESARMAHIVTGISILA